MAPEAKEKGTHRNAVKGHFTCKIAVRGIPQLVFIWIVRAREARDNFHFVEFKIEIRF